jgi:archaetidylinositol phosphate synthase
MLDTALGRSGAFLDRHLNQLADFCIRRRISPDALTHGAVGLGIFAAILFALGWMWTGMLAVIASGTADALDGRVARRGRGMTPWGGVLDLTFDRIVEASVLLGIALPRPEWHAPALVLAATWYVNLCVFLAVGAASNQAREKVIVYPPGLLERSELLLLALIVIALPRWAALATYTYAALEIVTAAQRFAHGRRSLAAPS